MAVTTTKTNKPLNPRGNDQSPKGYNRASLFSGKALDFDGVNDVVTTANNLPFSSGDDLSIVSYFKIDDSNEGYFYQNAAIYLAVYRDGSTSVGELSGYVSGSWLDTGYIVNDSKWYQVAQIVDNGTQRIYLNGQEIATQSGVSYNPGSQTVLNIGKRDSNYLNGQMANLKAFNVALTADQVADLYNNPEKIVPTGVADSALKLWLPMMEGAGTTAYDGSGNGNHGTISGATWTHGIGAPVAQTAVIDWNKGTNELLQSNNFDNASWGNINLTIESGQTGFDGTNNAFRFKTSNTNGAFYVEQSSALTSQNVFSVYAKADGYDYLFLFNSNTGKGKFYNLANGTLASDYGSAPDDSSIISIGDGWYKCTLTNTPAAASSFRMFVSNQDGVFIYQGDGTSGILVQHSQVQVGTDIGPYVETLATRQTSPVLLPQGLTSGRDITGVNLFENVRKQGALNLDGNSWAEVHDNASLDITDAITLEAWVYLDETSGGGKGILGKWYYSIGKKSYLLYLESNQTSVGFYVSANGAGDNKTKTNTTMSNGNWYHVAGVYDGSNISIYLNGSLETSLAFTSSLYVSDKDLQIGILDSNTTQEYEHQLAQPRIYNRALTAEEVERNYNAGKNIYK